MPVHATMIVLGTLAVAACAPTTNGQGGGGLDFFSLLWLFFILSSLAPLLRKQMLDAQRQLLFRRIQQERGSRVITLIHRQETLSFLGFPVYRFIDIDDSEALLRAIHLTSDKIPIDLVLHTPGGLVLAAEQIARAILDHPSKVTVFVPHYAMSGGTLIALAADEIVMDRHAVLGPVDPQLGSMPAASLLSVLDAKAPKDVDDETLIKADMARKAIAQVVDTVVDLVTERMGPEGAKKLAAELATGKWTHDYPIRVSQARELGLPVSTDLPETIYALMALYPQTTQRRPSVEYIPEPTVPAPKAPIRERRSGTRQR
jgi:ClpP class serine protease